MKNITILTTLLFFSFSTHAFDGYNYTAEIEPFTTDGCSVSPEGTPSDKSAWLHCCINHDIAYWVGGSRAKRKAADRSLNACISQAGYPRIGTLYYLAVRNGGSPWLSTPWRWGYGWPYRQGYRQLTLEQKKSVDRESAFIPEIIEDYMRRQN